jgi:release factor glutamine methyltransferase
VTGSAPPLPDASATAGSVADLVERLATTLGDAAVPALEARQEAREIVAALYDVPRFWPDANAGLTVDAEMRRRAHSAAEKRARGAPLAYAVGRAAFRHLTLHVDERVLIPRPETEQLVDLVLARASGEQGLAVDVGTGSGAIALALASEGSFREVLATDVSLDALAVARANMELLEARGALRSRVSLAHGSLLAPLNARGRRANVIVSNPPYIAFEESRELPRDVRDWEPPVALFSGAHGLDVSARLVREAGELLVPGGLLALEVDARRAGLVAEIVASDERYHHVGVHADLTGRERFVLAVRR